MNEAVINNKLKLSYPDGFHVMEEEELTRYFGSAANRWGVFDPERNMIISVSWKKAGFFGFMKDAETVLIDAEAHMKRSLVNYQCTKAFKTKIGKRKGRGVHFEYRLDASARVHTGEMRVIKAGGAFYALRYIGRKPADEANLKLFEEVIESVSV